MPAAPESNGTDELVAQASRGDRHARQELLVRHRSRLRQMVAVRMDPRIAPRVDPSDVVQDALGDAARHLDEYLRTRPLPFYLWLRRLTWERLIEAQRRHIVARRRSVNREEREDILAGQSADALANKLLAKGTSPSRRLIRDEERKQLLDALAALTERDREILMLRYLEGLSTNEIATVLELTAGAVMTRHTRALARLRALFDDD
jgi:RNA polymerase sigma-70 factor (ECF subfamily)